MRRQGPSSPLYLLYLPFLLRGAQEAFRNITHYQLITLLSGSPSPSGRKLLFFPPATHPTPNLSGTSRFVYFLLPNSSCSLQAKPEAGTDPCCSPRCVSEAFQPLGVTSFDEFCGTYSSFFLFVGWLDQCLFFKQLLPVRREAIIHAIARADCLRFEAVSSTLSLYFFLTNIPNPLHSCPAQQPHDLSTHVKTFSARWSLTSRTCLYIPYLLLTSPEVTRLLFFLHCSQSPPTSRNRKSRHFWFANTNWHAVCMYVHNRTL